MTTSRWLIRSSSILLCFEIFACSAREPLASDESLPTTAGATSSGGSPTTGGAGASTNSPATGGSNSGGTSTGSASSGGTSSGGSSSGGEASSGGASSGGAPSLPKATVWLAGDSTVANGITPCPVGWGKMFDALFDERITVINGGAGGRSIGTWLYDPSANKNASGECILAESSPGVPIVQERWTAMLEGMKEGDYLLIQFGINDPSSTCPRHVGTTLFRQLYGMMAKAALDRGAHPIFVTPVSGIGCSGSTAVGTRKGYAAAVKQAAIDEGVPLLDLHALSVALYNELGFCPVPGGDVSSTTGGAVGAFFCDDHTHFDAPGAEKIAGLVAKALVDQKSDLAAYVR